jgi:surface polysaccharide O-acyltransferase-like enzyme
MIVLMVFSIGFIIETLQYFGIRIFGNTFDPLDYAMYALGGIFAWIIDLKFFSKINSHADY